MTNAEMLKTIEKRVEELKNIKPVQNELENMTKEEGKKFLIDLAISTLLGV